MYGFNKTRMWNVSVISFWSAIVLIKLKFHVEILQMCSLKCDTFTTIFICGFTLSSVYYIDNFNGKFFKFYIMLPPNLIFLLHGI